MKKIIIYISLLVVSLSGIANSDVDKLGPYLPVIDLVCSNTVGENLILGGDMGFFVQMDVQKNIVSLEKSNAEDELAMYSLIGDIDESGFAIGTGGSVFKLENNTWVKVNFPFIGSLRSINSFGNNRLIITGSNGKFYTSINNGTTWKKKDASILLDINCSISKDNTIYLLGNNGLIISSDDFFETFTVNTGSITGNIASVCLPDVSQDKLLLFTHEGQIFEMNTADTSFTINYNNEEFTFTDWAQNDEIIVAVASENSILVSNNRGMTWSEKPHTFNSFFYTVEYFNGDFVLAGDDSYIVTFNNNQFIKIAPESDFDFQEAEIFESALFSGTFDGKILKSTNFDNQWETIKEIPNEQITGLVSNGTDELLFSTTGGEIYEYNSQSNTFSSIQTGISESGFQGVHFTNNAFFCVAESGSIYKRNLNLNWVKVYQTTDSLAIIDIFLNGNTGFAVGDQGKIMKTINGGDTWNDVQSGIDFSLLTVTLFNNTWYIGGMNGTIIYSNDATNWMSDLSISQTEESFSKLSAHPNGTDLLATTVSGKTIHFTENGTNWETVSEGFSLLTDVVWKDKLTAYSLGHKSSMYKISLDPPVSAEKIQRNNDFLFYPLPATEKLFVEDLSYSKEINKCQVFDLQGKLLQTVLAKNASKIEINVSGLVEGVYILKLVTNNEDYSQKIVVR